MSKECGINISLFIYPDLVWHPWILDWKVTFIIGSKYHDHKVKQT